MTDAICNTNHSATRLTTFDHSNIGLDVNYSAVAAASVKSNHEHMCYYPDSSAEHRTSQKIS